MPEHVRPLQVAVDGPAGAGKSTIGKGLAQVLGCPYLDTGLMYRAVTREALELCVPISDGDALASLARSVSFTLGPPEEGLLINGQIPGAEIRTRAVDAAVSEVSAHPQVREALVQRQRELAAARDIVMIGRDIGTVVLPDATIKFWVTASAEERARRRALQEAPGTEVGMLEAIRMRDHKDAGRAVSPLLQPAGAIVIATDELTPAEALEAALDALAVIRRAERASR